MSECVCECMCEFMCMKSFSGSVPMTLLCKALDSVVIEPFLSPTATLDSFTYHNPCEHTLLITSCAHTSPRESLRVSVSFNPSNLDLNGLAININQTRGITILKNSLVQLRNFSSPVFSNRTHSLYEDGVLIVKDDQSVKVALEKLGVEITRSFGVENKVEIAVEESVFDLCGMCGTVDGRLLYSDGVTEVASLADSAVVEDFASSWRVSPHELLLEQQGEECGN